MGTGSFPGVKSGRGVRLTPHPLLVPWSKKSRAIPLLLLWAVWPVQSLSACARVHFTLFYLILSDKCPLPLPTATPPLRYAPYNVTISNCERQAHSFTSCYLNSYVTHRYLTSDNIYLRSLQVISCQLSTLSFWFTIPKYLKANITQHPRSKIRRILQRCHGNYQTRAHYCERKFERSLCSTLSSRKTQR